MPSKMIAVRMPEELLAALKQKAGGRPWQTVMKELLAESLGLKQRTFAESRTYTAPHLGTAIERLRPARGRGKQQS